MKKQMQFELWQECNSLCEYCYLGTSNRCTSNEAKIKSLKNTLEVISDLSIYEEYDTLAYLGGEFFQGQLNTPEVKELFMEVMKKTVWLYDNGYIKNIWIYATMTIGEQQDLYDTLKLFDNKDGLWILTSYDTKGRFHAPKMEDNWKCHMKNIHNLYPMIKFNITTIITEHFIDRYMNNEFILEDFMKEYHASFFFKQCGLGAFKDKEEMNKCVPQFFPPRKKFINFLRAFRQRESELNWSKLFNIQYRADNLYRNFDGEIKMDIRHKDSTSEIETDNPNEMLLGPCGHLLVYAAYSDCDGCVICDKQAIESIMQ